MNGNKAIKRLIIWLIGVPGVILSAPFVFVLVYGGVSSLVSDFPQYQGFWAIEVTLLVWGGLAMMGLFGFWCWALTDEEQASKGRLIFIRASVLMGSFAVLPVCMILIGKPSISSGQLGGLPFMIFMYCLLGEIVALYIVFITTKRLKAHSKSDGSGSTLDPGIGA